MEIYFRPFRTGDETAFRELNEAWITELFVMEEKDYQILGDPQRNILDSGGAIFIAESNGRIVGCCALLAGSDGVFEVGKMAVAEELRGAGVGRQLLEFVLAQARGMGMRRLFLETHHKLANAIHLYESVGFRRVPAERLRPSPYSRSDVSMEMDLSE